MKDTKNVVNYRYVEALKIISAAIGFEKIKKLPGAKVRFPVYLSKEMSETSIEALELSVRSTNCLRRHGFQSIGELVEKIESGEDLKNIRGCGSSSIIEIMCTLMCYQFLQLDKNGQSKYIKKMRELNA